MTGDTQAEKLDQLNSLHQSGVLSDEEFTKFSDRLNDDLAESSENDSMQFQDSKENENELPTLQEILLGSPAAQDDRTFGTNHKSTRRYLRKPDGVPMFLWIVFLVVPVLIVIGAASNNEEPSSSGDDSPLSKYKQCMIDTTTTVAECDELDGAPKPDESDSASTDAIDFASTTYEECLDNEGTTQKQCDSLADSPDKSPPPPQGSAAK